MIRSSAGQFLRRPAPGALVVPSSAGQDPPPLSIQQHPRPAPHQLTWTMLTMWSLGHVVHVHFFRKIIPANDKTFQQMSLEYSVSYPKYRTSHRYLPNPKKCFFKNGDLVSSGRQRKVPHCCTGFSRKLVFPSICVGCRTGLAENNNKIPQNGEKGRASLLHVGL